jgi:hypothetical protein
MSRIHFDRLHSVEVEGDLFLVRTLDSQGLGYEWTIPREVAALLVIALREASTSLPDKDEGLLMEPIGFQAIVGPNMIPGIQIQLSDKLYLNLLMPRNQLAALRTSIAQLESNTPPKGPLH